MMSASCVEVRSEIDGPPIVDISYNLDLRQGPVLAGWSEFRYFKTGADQTH
jgi:hypothetical protein